MEAIKAHSGIAAPLPLSDINTDLIYPQQFLRKPDRATMGEFFFHSLRVLPYGSPDPEFILNREPYDTASILIAGRNLGSGSSREHAPWALKSFGFRCLISPMFADIFKANCINNGIIPATVEEADIVELLKAAENPQEARFSVDLETCEIRHARLGVLRFAINKSDRGRLLQGKDLISDALDEADSIARHERSVSERIPWLDLGSRNLP